MTSPHPLPFPLSARQTFIANGPWPPLPSESLLHLLAFSSTQIRYLQAFLSTQKRHVPVGPFYLPIGFIFSCFQSEHQPPSFACVPRGGSSVSGNSQSRQMTGGDEGRPPASKGCTCSLPTWGHVLLALHTFRHTG